MNKKHAVLVAAVTSAAALCFPLTGAAQSTPAPSPDLQGPTVPAPSSQATPPSGGSSPQKMAGDGSPQLGGDAVSPLEADSKAKQPSDNDFLKESAISFSSELAATQLAGTHATDAKVKAYAAALMTSQSSASTRLDQIAGTKNVTLSKMPDAKRQATLSKLEKTDPAKFDKAYIEQMAHDYQELAQYYSRQAQFTKDPAVKAYIAEQLPALQKNALQAKSIYQEGHSG